MTSLVSILGLGFALGVRHATDADHVVAVTTIVARERRLWSSSLVGALWGLGHTATILVVGGAILIFRLEIPPRLGLGMEAAVAAMLVGLGGMALLRRPDAHAHSSAPSPAPAPAPAPAPSRILALRPLLIGTVHGLAGSAAIALFVLAALDDIRWGAVYLGVFGIGTIAGMMLLTTAIALPFAYTARAFGRVNAWLARATGGASVALGVWLAYELVTVGGLLYASPNWTAH